MDSQAKTMRCVKCGADLEVVGVTASVRETVLFLGKFGVPGMLRVSSSDREVDEVRCANCLAVQPAKFAEALKVA